MLSVGVILCLASSVAGKKSARLAWSVADAFLDLSLLHGYVSSETLAKIIFVMYSRMCSASGVNEARKSLLAHGSLTMDNIPPTKATLLQHVRHDSYVFQAGSCPTPQPA